MDTTGNTTSQFSIAINGQMSIRSLAMVLVTFFALAIQLLLFRPLYRLASSGRDALYIIIYKGCAAIPGSLQSIFGGALVTTNAPLYSSYAWIWMGMSSNVAIKMMVLLFTFCRFWAIIFPWNYARIWEAKCIHLYAISTLIIASAIGLLATIGIAQRKDNFLISLCSFLSFLFVHLALLFYVIMLIKLAVNYWRKQSTTAGIQQLENDRIKMTIICMAALLPMLIDQLPFDLLEISQIFAPNSKPILLVKSSPLLLVNEILMTNFDEYVLLLLSNDFRKMVKKELSTILLVKFWPCKKKNDQKQKNGNGIVQIRHATMTTVVVPLSVRT